MDIPFYSGRYSILDLTAAALLEAKGPNPFWMKGEVGGEYSILGGMVSGNCNFEFELGDKCDLKKEELTPLEVIADFTPKKDAKTSVYETPRLTLNVPADKTFSFKDEHGEMLYFRVKLQKLSVLHGGIEIEGKTAWNHDKTVAVFTPHAVLPGMTTLKAKADIRYEQYKGGTWHELSDKSEIRAVEFKTGEAPDHIVQENVKYSYPVYMGYNYYRGESDGYIKLKQERTDDIFDKKEGWKYEGRLKKANGSGTPLSFDFHYASGTIDLALPDKMEAGAIYTLELLRVPTSDAQALDAGVVSQTRQKIMETDTVNIHSKKSVSGREEAKEQILYTMVFRNSLYKSFKSKFEGLQKSNGKIWRVRPFVESLTVNALGERFDTSEVPLYGRNKGLVKVRFLYEETEWYNRYVKPISNLLSEDIRNKEGLIYRPRDEDAYVFQYNGTRGLNGFEAETGNALENEVLSGMKNYIAVYSDEYLTKLEAAIIRYGDKQNYGESIPYFPKTLTNGQYPVLIEYYLPGKKEARSSFKYNIVLTK